MQTLHCTECVYVCVREGKRDIQVQTLSPSLATMQFYALHLLSVIGHFFLSGVVKGKVQICLEIQLFVFSLRVRWEDGYVSCLICNKYRAGGRTLLAMLTIENRNMLELRAWPGWPQLWGTAASGQSNGSTHFIFKNANYCKSVMIRHCHSQLCNKCLYLNVVWHILNFP